MPQISALLAWAGLLAAVLFHPGAPASAATLRTATTLRAPVVRLSDLFDAAGPGADRVLGPGPAPGGRIVVEAAQLVAIARQFDVDWQPVSMADRAVLERPGRLLPRDAVLAPLRAALAGAGAPADVALDLPDFAAPMIADGDPPEISVEQLDYDAGSGRFTASLVLTAPGVTLQRLRVSGRCDEIVEVAVPTHRLGAGTVIGADDLRVARVRAALTRGDVVRTPDQAIGRAVRRASLPGQPIALSDITAPEDVRKGGRVTMELDTRGLSLTALGVAMRGGAMGDRITVMNPNSRAIVEAEIIGPDRVRVAPDSFPTTPARLASDQIVPR